MTTPNRLPAANSRRPALGPGGAEGVEALGDGPDVELEVDIDDGHFGARPAPPGLAAGDADGQVEQAPRLIALAGAAEDELAALVQDAFDDLRRRGGGGLDELAEGEELRQRGRDDAELDGNVDLVES